MFIGKLLWRGSDEVKAGWREMSKIEFLGSNLGLGKKPKNDQVFGFSMYSINLKGLNPWEKNPIGLNQLQMGLLIPDDSQLLLITNIFLFSKKDVCHLIFDGAYSFLKLATEIHIQINYNELIT